MSQKRRMSLRLFLNLFAMSLRDRYLGSTLGGIWAVLNPILMLSLYTFVFGFVIKAKVPGADTTLAYAIWMISGLGPWLATAEGLTLGAHSIISGSSLIKNLSFDSALLVVSQVLTSFVTLAISIVFVCTLMLVTGIALEPTALLVFPLIVLHFAFLVGLGFMVAVVNVFFRDFGHVLPTLVTVLLFATPVLYPVASVPSALVTVAKLNPFYHFIQSYRSLLVDGQVPDILVWMLLTGLSVFTLGAGLYLFRRFRNYFESFL